MIRISPKLLLMVSACLIGASSHAVECFVKGYASYEIDGVGDYARLEPMKFEVDHTDINRRGDVPHLSESGYIKATQMVKAYVQSKATQMQRILPTAKKISGFVNQECHPTLASAMASLEKSAYNDKYTRAGPFYAVLRDDWSKLPGSVAVQGDTSNPSPSAASRNLSKDEIAQANYERLKLERDKPGSMEARDAAARYQALLGKQKFTAEDVAMANYERLKAQRDNPGSKEAREAAARYNAMRGQQTKDRDGPTVSKDELAMANYERLRLAREKPGSAEAKVAEGGYQALLKASQAQDKPARVRGPVLTRVEPKQPSAEEIAARKKADASGPSKPAAQSHSSQSGSSSPGSGVQTIICFRDTVPGPNQRCGTNKGSDAPGKGMSR